MNARAIISRLTAVIMLSVVLIAQQTTATTRYVSQDGSGSLPYKTWESAATNIQDAVDKAVPGDIILIDDGIYRVTNTIIVNKPVTINSVNGKDAVVIDGKGVAGCFQLSSSGAVLDGLTISNGYDNAGGGVKMHAGTEVKNSTIVACKASAGGGIWFERGGYVDNCLIIANYASSQGGGAYMDNGGVITNSVMAGNYVKTHGGAAYIMKDGIITDSVLTNNTAVNDGGAVNFNNGGLVERCFLSANKADKGGAVNIFKAAIRNCLVVGNIAVDGGGGYLKTGAIIESCTVADNEASSEADGLFFSAGGYLLNSIVYHNGTQNFQKDGGGMVFAYSCVTPNPGGIGMVTDDPMFVDRFHKDYHLNRESPAVDVGDNQPWMIDGVDLDGFPRIWNEIVDMGCYELVNPIFIDITTTPHTVEYTVTDVSVAGTNNEYVVGGMTVLNTANNSTDQFPAETPWIAPSVQLALGANTIVVSGTNTYGVSGSDSVVITRLGGPHVAITSVSARVTYNVTEYVVAGTNNEYVVGRMLAENTANGSVVEFNAVQSWVTPVLPLEVGDNLIVVTGTNKYGDAANDSITITRGAPGTGTPFIDITSTPTVVKYEITEIAVAGTNNPNVVGEMSVSNTANGYSRSFPATAAWLTSTLPLAVGENILVVSCTNALGQRAEDSVTIIREGLVIGRPFVDVTTTPVVVEHQVTVLPIAGTNNKHVVGGMQVVNMANAASYSCIAAPGWLIPAVTLEYGLNEIHATGTNELGETSSDSVLLVRRLSPENELGITSPNRGENYQVSIGEHITNFEGYVTVVPEYLSWSNTLTRSFDVLDNDTSFSFSAMLPLGINRIIVEAVVNGETLRDEITIIVNSPPDDPEVDVLATWPELIGATQTGTVEFVTTLEGVYTVFADTATGPVAIATGTCTAGWNLVDFYGGDLPNQLGSELSNTLRLQVSDSSIVNASSVRVVPDMVVDRKQFNTDLDGDRFKVIYINKTGARVTAKGRTLFVEGGAPTDKVKVIVKRNKNGGNRGAQICGVFSDSGVRVVKIKGALDRIETEGSVKMIKTKFGSLGQKNRSRLDYIKFRTFKGKSVIKVIFGNVSANVCVNPASDTGKPGTGGLKALIVKGGDIGVEGTSSWLRAGYSKKIMVKPKKRIGGALIDYSLYLSGESVPGSCASVKKIWANEIVDTSAVRSFMPNMKIICSYGNDVPDPRYVTDWTQYQVECTISKVLVKGTVAEGTFVLNALPTRAKLPLNNGAIWIIKGNKQ